MESEDSCARERFDALWRDHAARVQAYAIRHVGAHEAQDTVAETFTVAWRRRDDVPPDALPWLLVVARNTISNQRRAAARGPLLVDLTGPGALARDEPDREVAERERHLAALSALSPNDQEALLLTAWDGLAPAAAAAVVGCSPTAFKVRLHRARQRLNRLLDDAELAVPRRSALAPEGGRPT